MYATVELVEPGGDQLAATRGYISEDTDPRVLAFIAHDSLLALRNRGIRTGALETARSAIADQLEDWGLDSRVELSSVGWLGFTKGDKAGG